MHNLKPLDHIKYFNYIILLLVAFYFSGGFYMYIEGDGVYHGDSARMISPVCNTLGTQCMTFWYHMYGWATSMMLNVYLLEENHATKIWSRDNSQGNHWHLAQTEINPMGPFQVCIG